MCFISVPYIKQMLWDALHALKELAGRCCRHTDKCVWAVNVTIKPSCRSVHGWLFHVWRVQNENPEISHQLCPGHCPCHKSTLGTLTWKNCSQLLLSKRNQVCWQVHIRQRQHTHPPRVEQDFIWNNFNISWTKREQFSLIHFYSFYFYFSVILVRGKY